MTLNRKLMIGGLVLLAIIVAGAVLYQTTIARGQTLARGLGSSGGPTG